MWLTDTVRAGRSRWLRADRGERVGWLAIALSAGWFGDVLLGNSPNPTILGFAGTLIMVWATLAKETRRRDGNGDDGA